MFSWRSPKPKNARSMTGFFLPNKCLNVGRNAQRHARLSYSICSFPSSCSRRYTQVGKAGKAVISAGMPKSRPWTVISRLRKCLIKAMYQPADLHPCTLDSGNPCRNDVSSTLVYNDESSCLGMGFLKLQLPEERPSRSLQDKGSQAGAWEPAILEISL